jgi:hypothetical protein
LGLSINRRIKLNKMFFKDLKIGEKFHTGIYTQTGFNAGVKCWIEYEKITKSSGKAINQIGYGNTRSIGNINRFAAFLTVFKI